MFFDSGIGLKECYQNLSREMGITDTERKYYSIRLSQETMHFIADKRIWIEKERQAHEEYEKRRKEEEIRQFAEPLPADCLILSKMAGIREFGIIPKNQDTYNTLNRQLNYLYEKYGNNITSNQVYKSVQNIGRQKPKAAYVVKKMILELKEYADSLGRFQECWIDIDDSYWAKINLLHDKKTKGFGDLALIKMYLSISDESKWAIVFGEIIRVLIDKGKHIFHAKISLKKRYDHICLWVPREDFFMLEKYLLKYDDILYKPLDFVPYRGKIGITREFFTWDSYNGVLSEIIRDYLCNVGSKEHIDVLAMYAAYVKAWNGDAQDYSIYKRSYKESNAWPYVNKKYKLK